MLIFVEPYSYRRDQMPDGVLYASVNPEYMSTSDSKLSPIILFDLISIISSVIFEFVIMGIGYCRWMKNTYS